MEITTYDDTSGLHVRLAGRSEFSDYKLMEQLCQTIEQSTQRWSQVSVDLASVEFIDSSGLGLLLLLKDHCDRHKINVYLKNPQGQVRKMLEVSRLNELFGLPYSSSKDPS